MLAGGVADAGACDAGADGARRRGLGGRGGRDGAVCGRWRGSDLRGDGTRGLGRSRRSRPAGWRPHCRTDARGGWPRARSPGQPTSAACPVPRSARQGRQPQVEPAVVEDDGRHAGDRPSVTVAAGGRGLAGDRGAIRRAVDVVRDEAQAPLLLDGQRHRWGDRQATVFAHGGRAAPGPLEGPEVWAQRGQRSPRPGVPFSRLQGGTGSRQVLDRAHPPKDSRRPADGARIRARAAGMGSTHWPRTRKNPGDDLFSRKAALSVSSALESLTSVFGMGTGVASPLESPGFSASGWFRQRLERSRHATGGRRMIFEFVGSQDLITIPQPPTPGQVLKRSSPRPLVPLSFIRHRTSTCGLSNRWSPCGLTRLTRWGTSSRGELRT